MTAPVIANTYGQLFGNPSAATTEFACAPGTYITDLITTTDGTRVGSIQFKCSDGNTSPVFGKATGTPTTQNYADANFNIQSLWGAYDSTGITKFGFADNEGEPRQIFQLLNYPPFGNTSAATNMYSTCPVPTFMTGGKSQLIGLKAGGTNSVDSVQAICYERKCDAGTAYDATTGKCEVLGVDATVTCPAGYTWLRGACRDASIYGVTNVVTTAPTYQDLYGQVQAPVAPSPGVATGGAGGASGTAGSTSTTPTGTTGTNTGAPAGTAAATAAAATSSSSIFLFVFFFIFIVLAGIIGYWIYRKRRAPTVV